MSWLKKRAMERALLIYTGKLGLNEDADEECEGFAYILEDLAREFATRALGAYTCSDMDRLHLPTCKEAIAEADKDE